MKKLLRHMILTGFAAILAIMPIFAFAEDIPTIVETPATEIPVAMSAAETALFDLINAARKDPLGMAESLGMNRKEVLKNLPEMAEILICGLPELVFDERLYNTAKNHTADMLANGYYAYESMDGRTVDQRFSDAGYTAAASGESLGLIFFNNFMDPDRAASQIFETMYKDELTPEFSGQRNILGPELKEAGISLQGGIFKFDRFSFNAYMTTCDFGTEAELADLQLLNMINQARAFPRAVAAFYGEAFPEDFGPQDTGLPAVAFNPQLYAAAGDHAADMVENEYVSHVSLDKRTPEMRVVEKGYIFDWMTEIIYRMPVYDIQDDENSIPADRNLSGKPVSDIFQSLYLRAIRSADEDRREMNLFSPEAVDAGLRISRQTAVLGSIRTDNFLLAVIEYAAPTISPELSPGPRVVGTVFDDFNQNGLYDAGEEIPAALVAFSEELDEGEGAVSESAVTVVTNAAGGFSVTLKPGVYQVWVAGQDQSVITVEDGVENRWMKLLMKPESDESADS